MLINGTIFTILSIVIPILLCIGISIFVKKKFNNYYGVVIGLVISGVAFGFLQAGIPQLYIVNEDFKVKSYRLFGPLNYTFKNDKKIILSPDPMEVVIINNSGYYLLLQKIEFGDPDFYQNKPEYKKIVAQIDSSHGNEEKKTRLRLIEPFIAFPVRLNHKRIDYFFDDKIPDQIKGYGSSNQVKFWLREVK